MDAIRFVGRWWTAFAVLISAAMLATAHAFERIGGYPPCRLCLEQREVYWFALVIGVPATLWALFSRAKGTPRLSAFLMFAIFATGAIVATFHFGGEQKWWDLPASCTAGADAGRISLDELSSTLTGGTSLRMPACDVAAWTFLGLSMAGWNAAASVLLAGVSLLSARRRKDRRRV